MKTNFPRTRHMLRDGTARPDFWFAVVRIRDGALFYAGPRLVSAAEALVSGTVHGTGCSAEDATAVAREVARKIRERRPFGTALNCNC